MNNVNDNDIKAAFDERKNADSPARSWWLELNTRDAFTQALARERTRMRYSKFGQQREGDVSKSPKG